MISNKNVAEEFRYERKFVSQNLRESDFRHLMRIHPSCFSKIFKQRQVNSIYFDTHDLVNCKDNLAGISNRLKIRIRWYGNTFGEIKNPVLELKIKKGELGKKISFKLKDFRIDKPFSNQTLQEALLDSNLPDWLNEKLKSYKAIILISYKREYFRSKDKKFRITLDNDLSFFKIRDKINHFKEVRQDKSTQIIELKYNFIDEFLASTISNLFPFRLTANSKYVWGIKLLE